MKINKQNLKIIHNILLVGILISGLSLFSCKDGNSSSETIGGHLLKLDTIRNHYNAKLEQRDWSTITEGKVNIVVKDDRIIIDHFPVEGPELITYFLQTATKDYDIKTDSLGRAEVLYLGRNLIVHAFKENKSLVFTVGGDKYPAYLSDFTDIKHYIGFGLGVRKFERGGLHDNVPYCLCKPMGSPSSDCTMGGDGGAHGCGTGTPDGSCEVYCSTNAFACCDTSIRPE